MKYLANILLVIMLLSGAAKGQPLKGLKIYINPGHGGYDSNDRNVVIAPFQAGDTAGFWESKSNLIKGLYLRKLLENAGAQVYMSRTENRTVDDRSLSAIAEEANANRADFMISIHSNAFNGVTNYPLMLFHGWDNNPLLPQSMDLANLFWDYLFSNQVTYWTYQKRNVRGDKSFAPPDWNGYGVLRPLTVPGLISEGSFHDYIPETWRLMTDEYKRLEAWHHFLGFSKYYGGNPGRKGKIAGFVKDSTQKVSDWSFATGSKDHWLPLKGAKVTLIPGNISYAVDQMNNGFYVFDNLDPGIYQVKAEANSCKTIVSPELRVDSAKATYYACYLAPHTVSMRDTYTEAENRFILYPNPAKSAIHFQSSDLSENGIFRITDISGKTLLEGLITPESGDNGIDIQSLSPGGYILHAILGKRILKGLFFKQ